MVESLGRNRVIGSVIVTKPRVSDGNSSMANQLSLAIVHAVHILQARLGDDVLVMLALDCHPLERRAFSRRSNSVRSQRRPITCDPAEMAAWTNYHFAESGRDWNIDSLCCIR